MLEVLGLNKQIKQLVSVSSTPLKFAESRSSNNAMYLNMQLINFPNFISIFCVLSVREYSLTNEVLRLVELAKH